MRNKSPLKDKFHGYSSSGSSAKYYRSLALITLLVVLTVILSWQTLQGIKHQLESDIAGNLQAVRDTTHEAVSKFFHNRTEHFEHYISRGTVYELLVDLLTRPSSTEELLKNDSLEKLRDIMRYELVKHGDLDFSLISPEGITIASMNDSNIGNVNLLKDHGDFLKNIFKGMNIVVLPMQAGMHPPGTSGKTSTEGDFMFFGFPVFDKGGTVIAAFTVQVNPAQDFNRIFKLSRTGKTGDTYAFNEDGLAITDLRFEKQLLQTGIFREGKNNTLSIYLRDPGGNITEGFQPKAKMDALPLTQMAQSALSGKADTRLDGYRDYRGVHVVGSWLWDNEFKYGIAYEIDVAEAFSAYFSIRNIVISVIASTIVLFLGLYLALLKREHQAERANIMLEHEIEERKIANSALRESKDTVQSIFEVVPNAIIIINERGIIHMVNPETEKMTGYSDNFLNGKHISILMPGEQHNFTNGPMGNSIHKNSRIIEGKWHDVTPLKKNGSTFPAELHISKINLNNKTMFLCLLHDITERKQTDIELKKLNMVLEESTSIIFITDHTGKIEYVNEMFKKITEYSEEESIGQPSSLLASVSTTKAELEELWSTIKSGRTWHGKLKNKKKSGQLFWVNAIISPIKNETGEITHFLTIQEDITSMMDASDTARQLAYYDETTGLLKRSRFMEQMEGQLNSHQKGILLLVDIDDFKSVNDGYGHDIGDALLRFIASILQRAVKKIIGDKAAVIGRLGEDDFAIFISDVDKNISTKLPEEIRASIENFQNSLIPTRITATIGVIISPEHGTTREVLLKRANSAVYKSREFGRNRHHMYRTEDSDNESVQSRLKDKELILSAIEDNCIEPWYQPLLDLHKNRISHYESLMRIRKNGEILLPGRIIQSAERFGLVNSIDRIITEKTIKHQVQLMEKGIQLSFAMNLSGKEMFDVGFINSIKETFTRAGADPSNFIFEITETAAIEDLKEAVKLMDSLKSIGCRFSLDDFGVGFTSFIYLREMPVDFIKIDGSFIQNLPERPQDQVVVKSIINVAQALGIKTVAEFVETEETLKMIREFGVDYAQGYLIGKPAPEIQKHSKLYT